MNYARLSLLALAMVSGVGCTTYERFRHQHHRDAYAITDSEIRSLRFYVSTEVLAHVDTVDGTETKAGGRAILLGQKTPGRVTDVGPDWIRVTFQRKNARGGNNPGVMFVADPEAEQNDAYFLATELTEGDGLVKVIETPKRLIRLQGREFRIVYGASATLLIDTADRRKLVDTRRLQRVNQ